ncbi:MAG: flagellar biosynthesis protein FlhA [Gammaproteobacteria bacterium]|nr:flagellar biosynthesis protein FlhA [Gammaproteobacteria bacterium]
MNLHAYLQDSLGGSNSWASRSSDIVLALLIVAIVALMILPLPTLMIDTLVAINIAVGLMLVLMGIYISSALQFSSFPSVLLISTLFRLALSVATTRMILLNGDAGHIIDTFGNMVAGGNLVVGLVVFLIITLVQFLVIAKGAERVAEVGARFTLDAMPGKQLSIDSDLRSGLIDKVEARAKRRELEMESKLHGSMDGAMKFVKGDAIAGIVIIIINLLGGLAIGIFQLGMDASAAMAKYSILTIGDGLVAQIPALLGAMSAGLIVTRATDNQNDRHLGDSIQKQFSALPRVMLVTGAICFLLALVPGFPIPVFVGMGMLLMLSGGLLVPALRARFDKLSSPSFNQVMDGKAAKRKRVTPAQAGPVYQSVPLLLELPPSLGAEGGDEELREEITECVNRYQLRSGVAMPEVRIHFRRDDSKEWLFHAFEVPITQGIVDHKSTVKTIVDSCEIALRRNGTLFLGIQETGQLLSIASVNYPDIVKEVLRSVPAQNIAVILRNLVEEEVSIRNLRGIMEGLVQAAQHEKDINNLTEFARMALARQTCYQYAPEGKLSAVALSPQLEEQLSKSLRANGGVQQLVLDPHAANRLRAGIVKALDEHKPTALLTSVQLRRHVRQLIVRERFDIPVLSYNELIPNLDLTVLHQVVPDELVQLASVK